MSQPIRVAILTVSDKGSRGEREDRSHGAIVDALQGIEAEEVWYEIVPDEQDQIEAKLLHLADKRVADLVLTTGGTGLAPRDVTPEATQNVIEKEVPGLAEVMRAESLKKTPAAMISRAVAGIRGNTLIVNLPGSPKGAKECLEFILPALPHGIDVLRGEVGDHTRPEHPHR